MRALALRTLSLFIAISASLPLLLQIGWFSRWAKQLRADTVFPMESLRRNYGDSSRVDVDDLVWYSPRPPRPRYGGWEDDFARSFKETHYDREQRLRCERENSPYKHPLVCRVPAYVPARLPLPPQSQRIPRVIFVTWMTRRLGRSMFTSIMSILHHNPEYELMFFTDNDVDRFVCAAYPGLVPLFSRLRSGAARTDVWRMVTIYRYGGVYLDADMTALGHLPIAGRASAVSSVGDWTHLPPSAGPGGVFEHWNLAFEPRHPLVKATLEIIMDNLRHPNGTVVDGEEARRAEAMYIIRLTGPAAYQRALQRLLRRSRCREVDGLYVDALLDPRSLCDFSAFRANFGNVVVLAAPNMNEALTDKLLDADSERYVLGHKHYNHKVMKRLLDEAPPDFCSEARLDGQRRKAQRLWEDETNKKRKK